MTTGFVASATIGALAGRAMASLAEARAHARGLLLRLVLSSEVCARAFATVVSGSAPDSAPPSGEAHPLAERLAVELEAAGDDVEAIERVAERARAELAVVVREPLANLHAQTYAELAAEVVERGESFSAREVAVALRCTPAMVRRARLAAGREPELGGARSSTATARRSAPSSSPPGCRSGARR